MAQLKVLRIAALAAMAMMALAPAYASGASAQSSTTVTIAKGKSIKIGWAGDLSLQLIKPSEGELYAAEIAVNRLNKAGGIQGFNVAIEQQDDQCKGEAATTVAQKFASEPDLMAVVGHVCSGATIPASDVYEKALIPIVSGSATANAVTNRGLKIVNRVAFNDDNQALGDTLFILNQLKATKIAVLDDNQSYGKGLASKLALDIAAKGGTITLQQSIDPDAKDYHAVLTNLLSNPPDVLFFGGYHGPAALLTQQMHELGLTKTAFFSDDGTQDADYISLAGKDAEGQYASSIATNPDKTALADFQAEFEKTFSVKYDDYAPYQSTAYDAAGMILAAIAKVGKVDASGNMTIDRAALVAAVRATSGYKGLTGTLTCDSKGECGAGQVAVYQVTSAKWVNVKLYSGADLSNAMGAPATMAATMSAGTMSATMAATK